MLMQRRLVMVRSFISNSRVVSPLAGALNSVDSGLRVVDLRSDTVVILVVYFYAHL